ncbi:hypothetical protein P7C70_g2742, partial [Phenoliferia sp. Uapishka_3]
MSSARPARRDSAKISYAGLDEDPSDSDASEAVGKPTNRRASKARAQDDDEDFSMDDAPDAEEEEDEVSDAELVVDESDAKSEGSDAKSVKDASDDEQDLVPEEEPVKAYDLFNKATWTKQPAPKRKPKKAKKQQEIGSDGEPLDDGDDGDDDGPGAGRCKGIDENLPPIVSLDDIFSDLVRRTNLDAAVQRLKGRKLRVGTMCSGTESPLLALGIVSSVIGKVKGQTLEVEHIFSCEIEPFKQAYIERNFSPPLLFRDVTELGDDEATTAYGGLAAVPGNIDMLVAGTSCVDYSPLNTEKKTIKAGGESGRTFFGMLDYVTRHKPKIVILENVSGAPWGAVSEEFEKIEYRADFVRLDTKAYYIPHTRTRGCRLFTHLPLSSPPDCATNSLDLIATPKSSGPGLDQKWKNKMTALRRPASVSLEAFLLPSDDPRITRARAALSTAKLSIDGQKRAPTDWAKCESRHHRSRDEEQLGTKRYLTGWQDGGGPPDPVEGIWPAWTAVQTERVTDLIDISGLRQAQKNVDILFKSAIWNLSQNVDRTTSSPVYGITPVGEAPYVQSSTSKLIPCRQCLTPNMIPFLTSRGGPLIGEEALSLQGIPIEKLLLTRESEDQLADLAGNAMSSTVVGSAILAALEVAGHTLELIEQPDVVMEDSAAEKAAAEAATIVAVEKRIQGEERLTQHAVNLSSVEALDPSMLARADQSSRKCECEGRRRIATAAIYTCVACGHSACEECKGRPEHDFVKSMGERLHPDAFESEVKRALPMRFKLEGFELESLKEKIAALEADQVPVNTSIKKSFLDAIPAALDSHEFHFRSLTRRERWVATFGNAYATLKLTLDPKGSSWTLYIKADTKLPANDPFRVFLHEPVARLFLKKDATSIIDGAWDVRTSLKKVEKTSVTIEHVGDEVPSWRADLGLPPFEKETRASKLKVVASPEAVKLLDRQIDGEYHLERKCGAPNNSLYRRTPIDPDEEPLYLFLDPSRSGEAELDCFVFANSCDRLDYGSYRSPIACLPAKWWPVTRKEKGPQTLALIINSAWSNLPGSKVERGVTDDVEASIISMPSAPLALSAGASSCSSADCLLSARIHIAKTEEIVDAESTWREIALAQDGPDFFSKFAWVFARLPQWTTLQSWQTLDLKTLDLCKTCCPPPPPVRYVKPNKVAVNAVKAIEDGVEAAKYEQALKARPAPMLVQTRQVGESFDFRIGLNVASLAHKALASLPTDSNRSFRQEDPSVEWRLTPADGIDLGYGRGRDVTTFTLASNKHDAPCDQPPHFKKQKLRPEQLRSLTWMKAQEVSPIPWEEEEIAEAVLPQLGWHAETKATRSVHVRGGVLADEVGYGKTAIMLGLISSQLETATIPTDTDRIGIKATLIIVPAHLTNQWPSEMKKFAADGFKLVTLKDINDLKKNTVQDFIDADIVLIADTILKSPKYWEYHGDFCGVKLPFDKNAGRYFRTRVNEASAALPAQIDRLRNEGAAAALAHIKTCRKNTVELAEEPEKRKKGAAYAAQQARLEASKKPGQKIPEPKPVKVKKEKKAVETETDPWNLAKTKDWTDMKAPPLAMFAFARLVIDEFTYLEDVQLTAVRTFRAAIRWILSGTPPLKDFGELKTIAALLHVHLGIDDENETISKQVKTRRAKERTDAESFHSFKDVRTVKWHARRDEVGQKFLDQFVRQNIAEIDEIVYSEQIVRVQLPTSEFAVYSELLHHLKALDENLTKIVRMGNKAGGDREKRLGQALGKSKTPEEALLKRSSHFSLAMDAAALKLGDATSVCEHIHSIRVQESEDCKTQLRALVSTGVVMHAFLVHNHFYNETSVGSKKADDKPFQLWLNDVIGQTIGDDVTATELLDICAKAGCKDGKIPKWNESLKKSMAEDRDLKPFQSNKRTSEESRLQTIWFLRERVHLIRRVQKELLGRNRAQRCFASVRDVQSGKIPNVDKISILTCCGHFGPTEEVKIAATSFECVDKSCKAPVRLAHSVPASSLCVEAQSGTFGAKLEKLVDIISTIPDEDRVLVFVQFDDLFDTVFEALTSYGIPTEVLEGGAKKRSDMLQAFQNSKSHDHKVLLLKVTDPSASGANLTVANWAVFVSPLLTETPEQYKAFMTQAIGRLKRYGQQKAVKTIYLLSKDTIDTDIYEQRTGKNVQSLIEAQDAADPESSTFPRTRLTLDRKFVVRKKTAKKGTSKDDDGSSAEESESEETDEEKPKAKGKGKGKAPVKKLAAAKKSKVVVVDSDEDEAEESDKPVKPVKKVAAKVKAPAKKATKKRAVESDDEEPVVLPKKKAGKKTAVLVLSSDNDSEAVPAPKSKKRPAESAAASTSAVKRAKKSVPSVMVPPLSPSKRASLQAASTSKATSAASATDGASPTASEETEAKEVISAATSVTSGEDKVIE